MNDEERWDARFEKWPSEYIEKRLKELGPGWVYRRGPIPIWDDKIQQWKREVGMYEVFDYTGQTEQTSRTPRKNPSEASRSL
jgi:hypothetical protein